MILKDDKYQNILAQMHELNRQNLLNEHEKNEELLRRIEYLGDILENKKESEKNKFLYKILYVLITITVINTILCFFILFNINSPTTISKEPQTIEQTQLIEENKKDDIKVIEEEIKEPIIEEEIKDDVISFNQENIEEEQNNDSFEQINPIIKKDTIYRCEDDNYIKIYKIPYTVEIKGKLYSDRFVFVLQNDNGTKNCMINKNDM